MVEVKNKSAEQVSVMFDGFHVTFDAGQVKALDDGVAEEIIREGGGDLIVASEEVVEEDKVPEDNYTAKENKKGTILYRKNGKLISKEDYEAR